MEKAKFQISPKQKYKDKKLDSLLSVLNENLGDNTKYKKVTYARLNMLLHKFGKSKKNWDRDIFIGNIMDAKNPAKFFWWKLKGNI